MVDPSDNLYWGKWTGCCYTWVDKYKNNDFGSLALWGRTVVKRKMYFMS
jgi:hypothetical protein